MSEVEKPFEANHRTYASQFSQGQLPTSPARKVAVLTCMDARIPLRALGADRGDIHVVRNAGGRVTEDAI